MSGDAQILLLICFGGDASGWWYPLIVAPAVLSKLRTFRWRNVSPCCEGEGILTRGILHVGLINLFKHGSRGGFHAGRVMSIYGGGHVSAGMPRAGVLKFWRCHLAVDATSLDAHCFTCLILVCSQVEWFGLIFNLGLTAHKWASLLDICATPCGRVCLEYAMWLTLR